ncbi:MAG: hypothetical protein WBQ10_08170 [Terriglobales bacterium]
MTVKHVVRFFLLALACCLLAGAQDSSQTNITGGGTSGKIAVFTGAHAIGNSIASQSGGRVHVAGGLSVANHATVGNNTIYGNNGQTDSLATGAGVFGELSTTGESLTGQSTQFGGGGTWGDGGGNDSVSGLANYAVMGTSDNKSGGIFWNNGPGYYTVFGFNYATGSTGFPWAAFNGDGSGCSIDTLGDLSCNGTKNAVVPVDGGKHWVAESAIESPNVWFEDFGSAALVGGVATVRLDARFLQTVNTKSEYHVFLTPNGDCKGLYVHQKTATDFEVRELGNGNASVKFDYRITALRKGYENVRFKDHSREFPASRDGSVRPETK